MYSPAYAHSRFLRTRLAGLAGGLALVAPIWSGAAPPKPAPASLGDLAPALPMAVQTGSSVMLTAELPPCAPPGDGAAEANDAAARNPDEPGRITVAPGAAAAGAAGQPALANGAQGEATGAEDPLAAVLGRPDPGLAGTGTLSPATAPVEHPVQCRSAASGEPETLPDDLTVPVQANYALNYEAPPPGTPSKVKWARPLGAPKPWFGGISTVGGMEEGDRSLTYRSVQGPSLSLGSQTAYTPAWGGAATIGGFGFSNLTAASDSPVAEGKLGYSSMFGHLDYTDTSATQGGVNYGSAAGSSALRYGLTKDWTLEGQAQSARALSATGLGSTYSVGEWGTVNAGATQSRYADTESWRYRLGYKVDVWSGVTLGYANEQTQAGYNDLSTYSTGPVDTRQFRNTLSAGVPMGAWGTLTGTYSGLRESAGVLAERHYGISQSMLLAPNVKLAIGADREAVSGDYAFNMNLSLPLGH